MWIARRHDNTRVRPSVRPSLANGQCSWLFLVGRGRLLSVLKDISFWKIWNFHRILIDGRTDRHKYVRTYGITSDKVWCVYCRNLWGAGEVI